MRHQVVALVCAIGLGAAPAAAEPLDLCVAGQGMEGDELVAASLQINGSGEVDMAQSTLRLSFIKFLGPSPPPGPNLFKDIPPSLMLNVELQLRRLSPFEAHPVAVTTSYWSWKEDCRAGRMKLLVDDRPALDYAFHSSQLSCGGRSLSRAESKGDAALAAAVVSARRLTLIMSTEDGQVLARAEFDSRPTTRAQRFLKVSQGAYAEYEAKSSNCHDLSRLYGLLSNPGSPIPRTWVRPPW